MSDRVPSPPWTPDHPDFEARLNAYLDGLLGPSQAAEFERAVGAVPALKAELDAARAIDSALRRGFVPPPTIKVPSPKPERDVVGRIQPISRRWVRWGLGFAALLILGLGLRQYFSREPEPTWVRGDALVCMQSVEEQWDAPKWTCKDETEFARFTKEKFGQAWTIPPVEGLRLVGWTYTERLTNNRYANVLMADYQGKHIALVVDQKQFDRHVSTPADHSLYAHRMGGCSQSHTLVMYELSPFDKPVLLQRIQWIIDPPPNFDIEQPR